MTARKPPAMSRKEGRGKAIISAGASRKRRIVMGAIRKLSRNRWGAYLRNGRRIGTYRMAGPAAAALAIEQKRLDLKVPRERLDSAMQALVKRWQVKKFYSKADEVMGQRIALLICFILRKGGAELREYLAAVDAYNADLRANMKRVRQRW